MMKRILFILAFLCVLDFAAMAQGAPPLCMSEVDGSPNKCGITRIKVTNGTLSITGSVATITISGGGGGSPGGSTTQVQYNDTGAFAGAAGFTFNGTSTVTLGVAGTSVGAIAFKNATSGTITLQPVAGALGTVTLSLPAATDTLVGLAATQTLTNKTLTAPVIATISNTGTLTLPTSTDTLVGRATTDTFTNKTLTASSNVLGGVTMTLGSDADGDIYYRASNVLTRLPKGTALQVLRMNAGATAPEWAAAAGGGGITVGTTTITSGTDTRVLYNNAGVVGEYAVTGTGNAVLSASPTLTGTVAAAAATFSGTIVQTSASATAFESGPNGSTNPVFRLVNSTASAATGLSITGNAAGSGVTLTALSSGSNESILLVPKGTGGVQFPNGAVASPAINLGDVTTGFYRPASNAVGVTVAGVNTVRLEGNNGILIRSDYWLAYAADTSFGSPDIRLRRTAASQFLIDNGGSGVSGLLHGRVVTARTADLMVTAAASNTFYTNTGASGTVNFTLPTAAAGLTYTFYIDAAQTLTIIAGASTTIRSGSSVTTTAGNVTANTQGNLIRIVATSTTQWVAESITGTWTFN